MLPAANQDDRHRKLVAKRVTAGKTVGAVAKEMGLVEQTLRNWVKALNADKLDSPGARGGSADEMGLSHLRAEVIRLKRACDSLRQATADVARDAP
jgi:transposase